jgi:hypothetical protein
MSSHDAGHLERLDAVNIRLEHGRLMQPKQLRPEQHGYQWIGAELCPKLMMHEVGDFS